VEECEYKGVDVGGKLVCCGWEELALSGFLKPKDAGNLNPLARRSPPLASNFLSTRFLSPHRQHTATTIHYIFRHFVCQEYPRPCHQCTSCPSGDSFPLQHDILIDSPCHGSAPASRRPPPKLTANNFSLLLPAFPSRITTYRNAQYSRETKVDSIHRDLNHSELSLDAYLIWRLLCFFTAKPSREERESHRL
jgi:hypothetical protein